MTSTPGPAHATGPDRGHDAPDLSFPMPVDDLTKVFGNPKATETLGGRMGIVIHEASAQRLVGTMPVEGNMQPYGLLHGGASCVLAETLGSIGAAIHAGPDAITVGIEINATHHRSATSGVVTGVATPLHLGRTLATYEIVLTDENDKRVCTARLSCLIRRER